MAAVALAVAPPPRRPDVAPRPPSLRAHRGAGPPRDGPPHRAPSLRAAPDARALARQRRRGPPRPARRDAPSRPRAPAAAIARVCREGTGPPPFEGNRKPGSGRLPDRRPRAAQTRRSSNARPDEPAPPVHGSPASRPASDRARSAAAGSACWRPPHRSGSRVRNEPPAPPRGTRDRAPLRGSFALRRSSRSRRRRYPPR